MRIFLGFLLPVAAIGSFFIGIPLLALPAIALAVCYLSALPVTLFVPKERAANLLLMACATAILLTMAGLYLIAGWAYGAPLVFQPYPAKGFDQIGLLVFCIWTALGAVVVGFAVSVALAVMIRRRLSHRV